MNIIIPALATFGEVDSAETERTHEAQQDGILCLNKQSRSLKNSAYLTAQQSAALLGFVVSAVLHTIVMSLNRLHGIKDRLKRLPEQIPHGGKLTDHTRLQE